MTDVTIPRIIASQSPLRSLTQTTEDSSPSALIKLEEIAINVRIQNTQAQINEQGYTYNQAGFAYNQSGVSYGGVYNYGADITPEVSLISQAIPINIITFDKYTTNSPIPNTNHSVGPGWFMYVTIP